MTERSLKSRQSDFLSDHNGRVNAFQSKRAELKQARDRYADLRTGLDAEKSKLQAGRRTAQLRQFLSGYFIQDAHVVGIGPGLKAKLRSWNIETAADVTSSGVQGVPGFGQTRVKALLDWRGTIEQRFRFDPSQAILPSEIALIDQRYAPQRQNLENMLMLGVQELNRIKTHDSEENRNCEAELRKIGMNLAHARAEASQFTWW
jgi:DNA-binding helix-hairpin-helix protein with protein kinase domain